MQNPSSPVCTLTIGSLCFGGVSHEHLWLPVAGTKKTGELLPEPARAGIQLQVSDPWLLVQQQHHLEATSALPRLAIGSRGSPMDSVGESPGQVTTLCSDFGGEWSHVSLEECMKDQLLRAPGAEVSLFSVLLFQCPIAF